MLTFNIYKTNYQSEPAYCIECIRCIHNKLYTYSMHLCTHIL